MIILDCTTNEDCTGTTDTCKEGRCYCGSEGECTGRSDKCAENKCKCGESDKCSPVEMCSDGKCIRK